MRRYLFILFCVLFSSTALGDNGNNQKPLFEMDGKKYSFDDLSQAEQSDLYKIYAQNYKSVSAILEEVLLEKYYDEIASKKKISVEQVMEQELKIVEPTEKEIKKYYNERKSYLQNYSYDQIKFRIKKMLTQQKMIAKREALVSKLKQKQNFRLFIKEPNPLNVNIDTKGLFSKTNSNANVTIIEFCSYRYNFCKHIDEVLDKVVKKEKVNLVFIPVSSYRDELESDLIKSGFCAEEQGKYWKYHSLVYEKQASLSKEVLKDISKKIKLDVSKYETCLSSREAEDYLNRTKEIVKDVAISEIPALFINNKIFMENLLDDNVIAKAIEKEKADLKSKK